MSMRTSRSPSAIETVVREAFRACARQPEAIEDIDRKPFDTARM
jgi:hypothetical protein